jgi:hypothetical protein
MEILARDFIGWYIPVSYFSLVSLSLNQRMQFKYPPPIFIFSKPLSLPVFFFVFFKKHD